MKSNKRMLFGYFGGPRRVFINGIANSPCSEIHADLKGSDTEIVRTVPNVDVRHVLDLVINVKKGRALG